MALFRRLGTTEMQPLLFRRGAILHPVDAGMHRPTLFAGRRDQEATISRLRGKRKSESSIRHSQ